MVKFLHKLHAGVWLVGLGLEPRNIERIKQGDPILVRLREIAPECPDYTISIAEGRHVRGVVMGVNEKRHLSLNFDPIVLDRMVEGRPDKKTGKRIHPYKTVPLWQFAGIDRTAPPIELLIFYTPNVDEFQAQLVEEGVTFGQFIDRRQKQ